MYKQKFLELSEELEIIRDYISLKFGSDFKDYCGLRGASQLAKVIPNCSCQFEQLSPGRGQKRRRVDNDEDDVDVDNVDVVNEDNGLVESEDEVSNDNSNKNGGEGLEEINISNQISLRTREQVGLEQEQEIVVKVENNSVDEEDDEDPLGLDFDCNETNNKETIASFSRVWCPVTPGDPSRHLHLGISYDKTKAGNEKLIYKSETFKSRNKRQNKPRTTNHWACIVHNCPGRLAVSEEGSGKILSEKEHDHNVSKKSTQSSKVKGYTRTRRTPKSKDIDKVNGGGQSEQDSDDSKSSKNSKQDKLDISFAKTEGGNERLIYQGYTFRPKINRLNPIGKKLWVCCIRNGKCKCTLIQESDKSITIKNQHAHPPNTSMRAKRTSKRFRLASLPSKR